MRDADRFKYGRPMLMASEKATLMRVEKVTKFTVGKVTRIGTAAPPSKQEKLTSREAERILQAALDIAENGGGLRRLVGGNARGRMAMKARRLRQLLDVMLEPD